MVRISCHSRNYGPDTPERTLWLIKKLGFDFVTLDASTVPPQWALENVQNAAEKCRRLLSDNELAPVEYVLSDLSDGQQTVSATSYDPSRIEPVLSYFRTVCAFAGKSGFQSVMLVAGDEQPALGYEGSFDKAAQLFARLAAAAQENGVQLCVEPGQRSILNSPDRALRMIQAVPGLCYTLDPLQWQVHGYDTQQALRLLPYTHHLHARQAATGWNKCPLEYGEIDYALILKRMRGARWDGVITMEFWLTEPERYGNMSPIDQTIVLRYQIKQLIRKYWADTVMR